MRDAQRVGWRARLGAWLDVANPHAPVPARLRWRTVFRALVAGVLLTAIFPIFALVVYPRKTLKPVLAALVMFTGWVIGFRSLVHRLLMWVQGGGDWRRVLAFVAAVWFGTACHGFRENQRHLYGAFELAFGLVCIWEGLDPKRAIEAAAGLILGGVFVLVRGVDNTRLGWEEQSERQRAWLAARESTDRAEGEP